MKTFFFLRTNLLFTVHSLLRHVAFHFVNMFQSVNREPYVLRETDTTTNLCCSVPKKREEFYLNTCAVFVDNNNIHVC